MNNRDNYQIPDALKRSLRTMLFSQIKNTPIFDIYELELFDWYVKETEKLLDNMLSVEHAFIKEQLQASRNVINDSGMVAVEYYLKRVRYSHVIYMTSLLETFLERSCRVLTTAVGAQNIPFTAAELKGDQWTVKRKFLERYGKFSIPDSLWSEIQALINLRNNLAHDNGDISGLKPEQKNMLAKHNGLNIDGDEVVIEADFIQAMFEAIKAVAQFVEKEIGALIDRAIRPKPVAK